MNCSAAERWSRETLDGQTEWGCTKLGPTVTGYLIAPPAGVSHRDGSAACLMIRSRWCYHTAKLTAPFELVDETNEIRAKLILQEGD